MGTETNSNQALPETEQTKVRRNVMSILTPEYDRELVADQIISAAWEKGLDHVSIGYIKNKCISAWRTREREQRRNESFSYLKTLSRENFELHEVENKSTVETVVQCLSIFERKLIWLRFWKDLTLEQIAHEVSLSRETVQKNLKVALYKMRIELVS